MKAALLVAAMAAGGCGTSGPAAPSSNQVETPAAGPIVVRDRAAAFAAIGREVRVEGLAVADKMAALVDAGALNVYCLEPSTWPPARVGQPVAVVGTLEHTDELEATVGPDGEVSQGVEGKRFVIRRCTIAP